MTSRYAQRPDLTVEELEVKLAELSARLRRDDNDDGTEASEPAKKASGPSENGERLDTALSESRNQLAFPANAADHLELDASRPRPTSEPSVTPPVHGGISTNISKIKASSHSLADLQSTKFFSFGIADASQDVEKMIPSQIGSDNYSSTATERLCAKDMRDKVHFEKQQRMIAPHGWKRGRALLAPKQTCDANDTQARSKEIVDLVAPRMIAGLLEGENVATVILSAKGERRVLFPDIKNAPLASFSSSLSSISFSEAQTTTANTFLGEDAFSSRLVRHFSQFDIETEPRKCSRDQENGIDFFVLRAQRQRQGNDTAPNTVMNHVLILEIPEESLATALHSNIPLELELLLARESVLGSKTLGEALRALHGTQIVAAHEHLYFAALDILHEGERAPSDVDVCDADQEESQGTKAEAQIALCAVDEDKIETTLGPVVASTLVHAFVSQGVDRVCARFREHAMRNIWSEISQDATARLAASGEMVRDLQQVNSALRVQRDAAIDELRGMRDELERARENALEANRAAREKALAMEDLQMNLASLNTSMGAVENDRKTMQATLKLSKEEIRSLQVELGKAKDCLAETLLECDVLRNKAQDQADTLAEVQLHYLTSRSECDKYNNELRTTKAQLGHVQGQLCALKTRNLVSEEKEREAADKLRATQELLSAAQTQRQAAQKELAQTMEKLAKMRTKHAKLPMRVETKQQEVEPEILSDDDEDASEGREDNTITMRKNTRSDFKSPVTPRIALEDALAGLAAKARLKSPNSPFCVKQASLPSWSQDPQIVAPSLLDSPAAEVHCGAAEAAYSDDETSGRPDAINTERVVANSGHSKKSNNDVEDHDSLMEERKTSEEESTPRTLGSKERLHVGSTATLGSPRCEEALEPQLECLQSQVRLFQRTSQHQKGVILEQERRIATLQAQLLAQSASNSEASDGGSLSVSVPQATASTFSSAVLAPGASRVGHPSPTLLMNQRRPESSLPLSPTNQRSTKLQDDACLSPCSFEAEAMDRAHQEELARVQREHRMTLVTMDNNHRQQIKSLQGVMKKALLEAQLRREATEVSQTLQGEGSETESDFQSELETAAKRTAELENELEVAIKQTSELEDQLEACRSRLCEQRCTLDEKDTILQAKDQLLQAYASQIRMQRSVSSLPKQDLHIELLGKVASRALATACQQQCIVEALRTAHKTEEAEVMEASAMGSKNTVIAGLRCQIASQVAVIDSERRATQAALGQSDMALAEKRQAEAKLEEERKAHAATKSLLADAEACIRSQMEHMEHTAPRSILMGENASAGDKNDDGMVDNDADDDEEEEEDEEDNFQYSDNEDTDASSSVMRKLSSSPRSFSSRSLSGYVSPVSASPASPRSRSSLSTCQSVSPRRRPDLHVVTVDRRPPLSRTHSLSSVSGAPPRHPEPRQYFETENSPLAADGVVSAGRRGELGISRSSSMSAITARVDSAGQLGSARSTSSSMILGPALEHIERLEEAFRTQRAQIRVYHGLVDKSKHGHAREVTSMRRVAAGLHASRVAIERSFASERRNLLVRVHHLERELQETKLALQGEINCLQARADDLANKVLHADSEEVREVVQKMCTISERLRALRPVTSEMVSADAQERHAMQEQLQLLELTCERQRIKHAEALAEALAEAEHHKDCRENLRQKYNALQPQSAFEIFDSFHVPNDMESTKRARIERILEDLRVTLASLEPYLVRDERL